ncbi:hypothetical protein JTB14_034478 [Gonioctena quinquepunctata]|nr:hypothetical protein JTB14_034478 [Gonioctena quinquepunctata]
MEKFQTEKIFACGTIRNHRKELPKNLINDEKMKRGDYDYTFSSALVGSSNSKINKTVTLISNFHGSEKSTVKRKQKDGTSVEVICLNAIKDYNILMGGVDHADQLRSA